MFYTVYKITNNLNNKFYIGMHQTENLEDGYMGSGRIIKKVIKKYGVENFTKEILHVFDNEIDMRNKEKELVVISEESYNLCPGGKGGFGYINSLPNALENQRNGRTAADKKLLEMHGENWRLIISRKGQRVLKEKYPDLNREVALRGHEEGWLDWSGKKHSAESIEKMKKSKKGYGLGSTNSQYGSMWITDGATNKKIKSNEEIPIGWKQGRSNCAFEKNRSTTHWIGKKHSEKTKKKISESLKK